MLSLSEEERKQFIEKLLTIANQHQELAPYTTVRELSRQYHDDVGLFVPLLLNVITLEPEQAMFLDACTPHTYINGTALEIMANSDNVLRAGLTSKHIDIEKLVSCTLFEKSRMETLVLELIVIDNVLTYPILVPDFRFSVFIGPGAKVVSTESAEILFTLDEDLELIHENGDALTVQKGQSVFIPACTGGIH